MRITKYGHACLMIEEGDARILTDPGAFSRGFEELTGLDAILITHQHQDHVAPESVKGLIGRNPEALVYADEETASMLRQKGLAVREVRMGDSLMVKNVTLEVVGEHHAQIHQDIPGIANVGYVVAGRLFYPGDALTDPGREVEILVAPVAAPWMTIGEAVDYIRAVRPMVVLPVHDAVLSEVGKQVHLNVIERLTVGMGVQVVDLPTGEPREF